MEDDELVTEPQAPKRRGRPPGSTKKPVATPPRATASKQTGKDYTKPLNELVDTISSIPTALGLMRENDTLLADGYVLKVQGRAIASAVNDLAQQKPEVARALDSLGKSTPYAALAMAVLPLALQLAANHIPKFANLPMVNTVEDLANAAKNEIAMAQAAEAEMYA